MTLLPSWSSPAGSAGRGGHLDRLHSNLLDLDKRLRDAVAQAIGQAAAGVIRQIALSVLGQTDAALMSLRPANPSRPLWETLDEPEERDRQPWSRDRDEDDFLVDRDTDGPREIDLTRPSLWGQALAIALPALGWWLHRRAGRQALGVALGCGLVCGFALHRGGRQAASTGLALALLTESVRAVAALGVRHES